MIARKEPARKVGRGSFADLQKYLEESNRKDLVAAWSHGVADHQTAGVDMDAHTAQYKGDPVLHLMVSFRPGEVPAMEDVRLAENAVVRSLGVEDNARICALHYHDDDMRYHLHLGVSKVSPQGKSFNPHNDFFKLHRAAEYVEREGGFAVDRKSDWRKRVGERDFGLEAERQEMAEPRLSSWADVMRRDVGPVLAKGNTWENVHAALRPFGAMLRERGGGFTVEGPEAGQRVKLSDLGVSAREMRERLGEFAANPDEQPRSKIAAPKADAIAHKAAQVAANPEGIIAQLAEMRSTWTTEDVMHEIAVKIGASSEDRKEHKAAFEAVAESVGRQSVTLAPGVFSTAEVVAEERALFAAYAALHARREASVIRKPSDSLDGQQKAAYAHLADGGGIVKGIAGAGKSRMVRDYAEAKRAAGRDVMGASVFGSAARVLGEEAQIASQTVAQLLADLRPRDDGTTKERLTKNSTIILDEGSTLDTRQACELFERVRAVPGAELDILCDVEQHESVGRGAVARALVESYGSYDMAQTRRGQTEHLRDLGTQLRAGKTAPAFDSMRKAGEMSAYADTPSAIAAQVRRYVASVEAGRSAIAAAPTNADAYAFSVGVRSTPEIRAKLGEERSYRTAFGQREFAVGDLVAAREPNREAAKSVNGDLFRVVGHRDDGRLDLMRERVRPDGSTAHKAVVWDVAVKPGLDWGYATTSIRSQGRTVDDSLPILSPSRRGAYVDITRARQTVHVAYGEDRFRDFGSAMAAGQRDNRKTLVRDFQAPAREVAAQSREQSYGKVRGIAEGVRAAKEAAKTAERAAEASRLQREARQLEQARAHEAALARVAAREKEAAEKERLQRFQERFGYAIEPAATERKPVRTEHPNPEPERKPVVAEIILTRDIYKSFEGETFEIPAGRHNVFAQLDDYDEIKSMCVVYRTTEPRKFVPERITPRKVDELCGKTDRIEILDEHLARVHAAIVKAMPRELHMIEMSRSEIARYHDDMRRDEAREKALKMEPKQERSRGMRR